MAEIDATLDLLDIELDLKSEAEEPFSFFVELIDWTPD